MAVHLNNTKKEIKRHMDRLMQNIKKTGGELLQELDDMYQSMHNLCDNHVSYLEYTMHILGGFQFFLHSLTQPGQEPLVVLHEQELQQHLDSYTLEHICTKEAEALQNLHKIPSFNCNVQISPNQDITIGHLSWEEQEALQSSRPVMKIPQAIISIPGGHKRWETGAGIVRSRKCQPHGLLYTDPQNLLVAEHEGQQISVYDDKGDKKDNAIKTEAEGFFPRDIALNKEDGLIYTTDDFKNMIRAFNKDGELVTFKRGIEKFNAPWAIATNGTYIVVSDTLKHSITVLKTDGQRVLSFGKEGSGIREFKIPEFLIIDDQDQIVVSDRDNHRISIFDFGGHHIRSFGSRGNESGQLEYPSGICQDEFGNYLVVDCGNSRVCRFSRDGVYENTVIQFPIGSIKPFGITISTSGDVALTDRASDKIVVYKLYNLH
jgi:sugar lactone lactonase YvrE